MQHVFALVRRALKLSETALTCQEFFSENTVCPSLSRRYLSVKAILMKKVWRTAPNSYDNTSKQPNQSDKLLYRHKAYATATALTIIRSCPSQYQ